MILVVLIIYLLSGLVYCSNFGYFTRESLYKEKQFRWWGFEKKSPIYKAILYFFMPVVLLYLFLKA